MTRRWSRRAVLAALASSAGCLGGESSPEMSTDTPMATGTPTATPTPTDTPTASPSPTPEPVEVREWPDEYYGGPLVSAHEHMHGPDGHQMTAETMDWFVRWMDRNRVDQVIGFAGDGYLDVVTAHDDRVVPFAFAWKSMREDFDRAAAVLEQRLDDHPAYEGIGEVGLKPYTTPEGEPPVPADHSNLLEVYDLAAERDIPIMLHGSQPWFYSEERRDEFEEPMDVPGWASLERAYAHNRDTQFLVHATYQWGKMNDGEIVAGVLERNPNVTYDISDLHPFAWTSEDKSQEEFERQIAQKGVEGHAEEFYQEHARILKDYSDRVTWGMDASYDWHYTDWALDTWVDVARSLLGRLPEENARNVGYRTAADLLDIEVERES